MAKKISYSLSEEQFKHLREKLSQREGKQKFSEHSINLAYRVMVNNESAQHVADTANILRDGLEQGVSRQNVYRIVRDLHAIFHDLEPNSRVRQRRAAKPEGLPLGWVRILVTLPSNLAKQVQDMESQALAELELNKHE